jgi:RHS repeat-associated protein
MGQIKSIADVSGTRTLDYAVDSQLIAEHLAFGTSLFTLHEKFDTFGRDAGYVLSNEVALITGTMQGFDIYGRLNQVAVDGSGEFTYGYLEGSHLQKTLAMPNGVTRTFGYEANRDLLTTIVHSNATDRLLQRDFTFDGLGRLENRTLFRANETPVDPDAFAYNSRSELTNAIYQITQSGTNAIRQFSYDFDPIGNRLAATEFGTNTSYIASALNQYTSISNSVNSVPLCEMNPEFDADGNQILLKTTTGIWHVIYNAENRPILFSNDTKVVEMAYDYTGRRFEYMETVNGTLIRHERYLYRGYLQIAALDMLNSARVKHTIAWDPSELTATRPLALQLGANAYYYSFDQVKNVTELFDGTGALAVTYDYSPFGQIVATTGNVANLITFSSEVHDATLGLQYYNYRHLNTLDGRWINRDPIEEEDGSGLYLFLGNDVENRIDLLGQNEANCCGYALTGTFPKNIQVPSGRKITNWLKKQGWSSTLINKASECKCACTDYKVIMVVWTMSPSIKQQYDLVVKRGKNPFDTNIFVWSAVTPITDYHFMRSEWGCSDDYMCVEKLYKLDKYNRDQNDKTRPVIKPEPVEPSDFDGKPMLCLCKPRGSIKKEACPCAIKKEKEKGKEK